MPRFRAPELTRLGTRIFQAAGAPADIAEVVAVSLVDANLAGHDSHGVLRIPMYVERVRDGAVRPAARPRVLSTRGATALLSGEWGFGQPAGRAATDEAMRLAREHGVALAGLVQCNHLGRMGEYMERAAAGGCAAMVWVGGLGRRAAVPHGGSRPALGTNPTAMGFPVRGEPPFVLDFATTAVAAGKLMAARAAHKPVPPGWIVDKAGQPSTDPEAYFDEGALLAFGAHKGYGLAVVVELLGHVLTGSERFRENAAQPVHRDSGALFCAIDAGVFRPAGEAEDAAKALVDRLRAVPPAPGIERVLTAGEPEVTARRARTQTGIDLANDTWQAIKKTAAEAGIPEGDLPRPFES